MSQHDDEEDRRAIVARRAMFIASAMSGLAWLNGCSRPQPCLRGMPPLRHDATAPQPCLHVAPSLPPDAAPDDPEALVPEAGLPAPTPCLSVMAWGDDAGAPMVPEGGLPAPMPCLSLPPPTDAGVRAPVRRRDAGQTPRPPAPIPSPEAPPQSIPQPCLSIAVPRAIPFKPDGAP